MMEMGVDRILFSVDYPFAENPRGAEWAEDAAARSRRHRETAERQRSPPAQALNGADPCNNVFTPAPSPINGPRGSDNG
jgi:hypothetical protein